MNIVLRAKVDHGHDGGHNIGDVSVSIASTDSIEIILTDEDGDQASALVSKSEFEEALRILNNWESKFNKEDAIAS